MDQSLKTLNEWINESTIDPDIKAELTSLKASSSKDDIKEEIVDRFYKNMEFGTGGLRGKIGAGTNRMNVHTVRRVSQAFAEHLLNSYENPSVVIAHDNRLLSDRFTLEAARVFAANGLKVYVFDELTPTPMLSYAVRNLKCSGGVVITASHNPREYNGYKIYDNEGCQCLPEEALEVAKIMDSIDIFRGIKTVKDSGLINQVPGDVNKDYYNQLLGDPVLKGDIQYANVVYTPLNGAGNIPVSTVLKDAGVGKLMVVPNQKDPDPNFPTCPKPNPEEDGALIEGLKVCEQLKKEGENPDILLATDPDSDRVGVVVNTGEEFERIDGNQLGIALFDFILERRKEDNSLPEKPVMITTIVSTPMGEVIARKNHVHVDNVLTGFKFIGAKIGEYETKNQGDRFIYGFEESCGYLAGTYVRDKDAVSASLLIAEMVGYYKKQKKTIVDRLEELYEEYGYFATSQKNFEESGKQGAERIQNIMNAFRNFEVIDNIEGKLVLFKDYEEQTKRTMGLYDDEEGGCSMAIGTRPILGLPKENVLEFEFSNRSKAIIRPSGTEPKLKIYFSSKGTTKDEAEKNIEILEREFIKAIDSV